MKLNFLGKSLDKYLKSKSTLGKTSAGLKGEKRATTPTFTLENLKILPKELNEKLKVHKVKSGKDKKKTI